MSDPAAPARNPPASVAVLGEALVDAYPDGTQVPGGAPFNVARWLSAFGVPTLFITRLGRDEAAVALRAEMARLGLPLQGVQTDASQPTGLVQVLPAADPQQGHRFEIAAESAWDHIDAEAALPLLQGHAPRLVCFGSLALRHAPSRAAIAHCLAATGALRVLDLNLRDVPGLPALAEEALHLADWVKVNDEELERLHHWYGAATLPALSQRFGVQRWVVTRGAQGWFTADAAGRVDAQGPAETLQHLQDTVGAGDAFTAAVLAGQAHGWPLLPSLQAANRLAAAVCTWRGALPPDLARVQALRQTLGFGPTAPALST